MTKRTKHNESGPILGTALVIAAAAGAYFLYGSKDAKKNRKVVKSWTLKAKAEVLEKLEKAKEEINEENYHKIVDGVIAKYNNVKEAHQEDIDAISKELKGHWKNIKKHITVAVKKNTKKNVKKRG